MKIWFVIEKFQKLRWNYLPFLSEERIENVKDSVYLSALKLQKRFTMQRWFSLPVWKNLISYILHSFKICSKLCMAEKPGNPACFCVLELFWAALTIHLVRKNLICISMKYLLFCEPSIYERLSLSEKKIIKIFCSKFWQLNAALNKPLIVIFQGMIVSKWASGCARMPGSLVSFSHYNVLSWWIFA